MTSAHFIFIPGVLLVGIVLGFVLGSRAARDAFNLQQKRDAEREQARRARAERRAARAGAEGGGDRDDSARSSEDEPASRAGG